MVLDYKVLNSKKNKEIFNPITLGGLCVSSMCMYIKTLGLLSLGF